MDVDWSNGAQHMWDRHNISVDEANEALADMDSLLYYPDPKGKTGTSARLIGYSPSRQLVIVVILIHRDERPGSWWGATGWDANPTDTNAYLEGK